VNELLLQVFTSLPVSPYSAIRDAFPHFTAAVRLAGRALPEAHAIIQWRLQKG
jgi:hypothetical protein